MAHIGKSYRLAFRRDLSLQINRNVRGWAHEYVALINNVQGSIANSARMITWILVEGFDPATGALNYESQHATAGGSVVYCKLVGNIGGFPPFYTAKMQWFKEPSIKLYEQTVLDFIPSQYGNFGKDQRDGVLFETPHVFECTGGFGSFNGFNAKTWH